MASTKAVKQRSPRKSSPAKRRFTKKRVLLTILYLAIIVVAIFLYRAHQHGTTPATGGSSSTGNCQTSSAASCVSTAPPSGFPNASTSGVPAGTTLTNYTGPLTLTTANTAISDKLVNGCLSIKAPGIVIKDSKIVCATKNGHGIDANVQGNGSVLVESTEVDGDNTADVGINGSDFTLEQVNVHGSHDGIHEGSNDTIKDSYVHDLAKLDGLHSDTVQVVKGNSATDDLFDHDTFDASLPNGVRLNSAFHVGNNLNHDFVIENSYLDGGSFTLQFDPTIPAGHNIEIINNAFGRDCNDGIFDGGSGVVFSGNYWLDNHQLATQVNSKHGACHGKTSS